MTTLFLLALSIATAYHGICYLRDRYLEPLPRNPYIYTEWWSGRQEIDAHGVTTSPTFTKHLSEVRDILEKSQPPSQDSKES